MYKRNPGILDGNKKFNGKIAYYLDTLDPDWIWSEFNIPVDPDPGKPQVAQQRAKKLKF